MRSHPWGKVIQVATNEALSFLEGLPTRDIESRATPSALQAAFGGPLPDQAIDAAEAVAALARAAGPGLLATTSGRFYGFVIGGALPASIGAEWLAAAWDQCPALHAISPAAAAAEDAVASWVLDLLGLPAGASVGFVTGSQMAHFTGLAAGRHAVLRAVGWDVEADGLVGAPPLTVIVGAERHVTVDRAVRYLGIGTARIRVVEADQQGRMSPSALGDALRDRPGPAIVCAQAGNINTGAIDPMDQICDIARDHGAWVHVDGAFGLWASASPSLRSRLAGVERADSWATDCHKWLNVNYDSGLVICAHPDAHRAAMTANASYFVHDNRGGRDPEDWNPELSRRARGFALWATLRSLGRQGVGDLVERSCALARRFAAGLETSAGVRVVNDVLLNQVLVRFDEDDETTRRVIAAVRRDGTCWTAGADWRGMHVMRISVSNWSTDEDDVDLSVAAILRCHAALRGR